jgi:hypothetical protein
MKTLTIGIDDCEECPYSSIYTTNCIVHASCTKSIRCLPSNGMDTSYPDTSIPNWCELKDKNNKEVNKSV